VLRTTIDKAYLKRTFRPLYGWDQMTPKALYLDANWDRSVNIWPGMCAMKTAGENVTLLNGTGVPYGLFGLYIGGDGIDEVADQGVNSLAVWSFAADAEAEILAPAFDNTLSWVEPGDGTIPLVFASAANVSARPIARLLKVNSASKITIGGLTGTQ
jgi:hypothetical protein